MRVRTGIAATALAALLFTPAAAEAKLPSPATKRIVPGRSIGGVKLGMDAQSAVKKWGGGGTCDEAIGDSCTWQGSMKQGAVGFTVESGKVASIRIEAGQKPSYEPYYRGPITKWKTTKRIGIGSAIRKVARAYPKAKPDPSGLVLRAGGRRTLFESSLGRVRAITIDRGEQ